MEISKQGKKKTLESIAESVKYGWDYLSFRSAVVITNFVKKRVLLEALRESKRRGTNIRIVDRNHY